MLKEQAKQAANGENRPVVIRGSARSLSHKHHQKRYHHVWTSGNEFHGTHAH
jgi:hypothetical protein